MPHNWARSPYYVNQHPENLGIMQTRTQIWDDLVAQTAQNTPNAIAIDTYDPMECVYDHPDLFGFTNVTDPAPALNDPDYLYVTGTSGLFHYGYQGQRLIKQVIQYYLTRGWGLGEQHQGSGVGEAAAARRSRGRERLPRHQV